ncbi:unnamed protein product, partial [Mesorhabditis belari]|uniref:Transmembrane protein 144 n=1 Tax=Mesorhabditis belari TaxID=2138241 RepID=A0AAF3J1K9_9BILA
MLGGASWAIGNATAIPIMNQLGIGLGMLIWGITNCVMGWASGRFGLFGIKATTPSIIWLNYFGLAAVVVGGVIFSQVKPTPRSASSDEWTTPSSASPSHTVRGDDDPETPLISQHSSSSPVAYRNQKRVISIATALVAGFLYGVTFVPVIYMQDNKDLYPDASDVGLDYVFAHFNGIFVTSSIIFISYIAYSQNAPFMNASLVGPSLIAGTMWAIAQSSWFVANDNLSQAVTFPIISMVPGVVAALWSVFYFKEIAGSRNLKLLILAIAVTLLGAIFVGISK